MKESKRTIPRPALEVNITPKVLKRFWLRVNKFGPIPNHNPSLGMCWEWLGSITNGYGRLSIKRSGFYSHRISWVIHNGEIPNGLCVLHHCDNPICVNPAHLFLGTLQDNEGDKVSKGRQARGENSNKAKFVTGQIIEILTRRSSGEKLQSIADSFNVTRQAIWQIAKRRNWKHVPSP